MFLDKRNVSLNPESSQYLSLNKSIEMRSALLSPNERYKLLYKKQSLLNEKLQKKREEKQIEVLTTFSKNLKIFNCGFCRLKKNAHFCQMEKKIL